MPTHKLYGGSNADIWVNCAGSTFLSTQVPRRPTGQAAIDGTAQHAVMEQLINDSKLEPEAFLGSTILTVQITPEHVAAVKVALEEYLTILDTFPDDATVLTECSVDLNDEAGGTMDVGIVHGTRGATIDVKFGQMEVDVDGFQGIFYGVCATKTEPSFVGIETLDNYIIQPAYDPATLKTSYPRSFLDTMERTFLNAIAVSKSNDPVFTEGDWCTWCPGKIVCPLKTQGLDTLTRPDHTLMDLDKLGELLLKFKAWESWADDAKERLQLEIEHGRMVKDWKLVQKRAIRQWKSEAEAIVEFRRAKVTDDVFMPRKLVTPAVAEKGMLSKAKVKDLASAVSSGNTIAPMTDPRTSVLPTAALAAAMKRVK